MENAAIRPVEAIQGQASALQGNAEERELISLMREKWLITVITKQESSQWPVIFKDNESWWQGKLRQNASG